MLEPSVSIPIYTAIIFFLAMSRCPAGTDPIWDVLWMNTPAGERDMQSCSRSEEIGMFMFV